MYRNDLDAAHARIAALEDEVARLRAKPEPPAPPQPAKPRRLGRSICYHPPRTYVPFLRLLAAAVPAGYRAIRTVGTIDPPQNVLAWLLLRAFVIVAWLVGLPLYYFLMLPWFATLMIALTPVLVVIVALSRLSFSTEPPSDTGWFSGVYTGTDEEAAAITGAVFTVTTSSAGLAVPLLLWLAQFIG